MHNLVSHVGVVRPKKTIKIETKPGFCCIHKIIEHVGIVSHLDYWCLQLAHKGAHFAKLEDFAELEPQWVYLERIALRLVQEQVANGNTFCNLHAQPAAFCDQEC